MRHAWQRRLETVDQRKLYPPRRTITHGVNEPNCTIDGREYLSFIFNTYLSLTHHPAVREAGTRAVAKHGAGLGDSRVVAGSPDVVVELEEELARWTGFED